MNLLNRLLFTKPKDQVGNNLCYQTPNWGSTCVMWPFQHDRFTLSLTIERLLYIYNMKLYWKLMSSNKVNEYSIFKIFYQNLNSVVYNIFINFTKNFNLLVD